MSCQRRGNHHKEIVRTASWPEVCAWVKRLVELYPVVQRVLLTGSRTGSDLDLVLLLDGACYEGDDHADMLERTIAFDPRLALEGKDLYFVRPKGELHR